MAWCPHPHLKNLRTKEAALPPTQLNPSAGSGRQAFHANKKKNKNLNMGK